MLYLTFNYFWLITFQSLINFTFNYLQIYLKLFKHINNFLDQGCIYREIAE